MKQVKVLAVLSLALVLGAGAAVAGEENEDERVIVRGGDVWVIKDGEVVEADAEAKVIADRIRVIQDDGKRLHVVTGSGASSRVFLGITMAGEPERGGVRILSVVSDSGAGRAGLKPDDVIVSVGGKTVGNPAELSAILSNLAPGDEVDVEIERGGERRSHAVELGERPSSFALSWEGEGGPAIVELEQGLEGLEGLPRLKLFLDDCEGEGEDCIGNRLHVLPEGRGQLRHLMWGSRPKLGVGLTEVTPELREHLGGGRDAGVLVSKVMPGTPAARDGIRVGDLITAVDGERVGGPGDLVRLLSNKDGRTITVDLIRDRRPMAVSVSIPEPDEDDGGTGPRA